jgi:hypothetical protein
VRFTEIDLFGVLRCAVVEMLAAWFTQPPDSDDAEFHVPLPSSCPARQWKPAAPITATNGKKTIVAPMRGEQTAYSGANAVDQKHRDLPLRGEGQRVRRPQYPPRLPRSRWRSACS